MVAIADEFARVYERLPDAVDCGHYVKCRCPAHDDRRHSLSVFVHPDGRALVLKCHAGCGFHEIREAIGLRTRDFFREDGAVSGAKIVATYDYVDEDGTLLFQVCRKEWHEAGKRQKTFVQRRPDDQKKWVYSTRGVRRVLYRLPDLLKHPKKPVIVVEGEKSVDYLQPKLKGVCVTTSAGGANAWQNAIAEPLSGRKVAIVPDCDEPGVDYALSVAGSCVWHGAQSVRLVRLPDQKRHDGADDWVARKGSAKALLELIRETPEWKQT